MRWKSNQLLTPGKSLAAYTFERDQAAYDRTGTAVAADEPRYARRKAHAARPTITGTGKSLASNSQLRGCGVDHDNSSPILVSYQANAASTVIDYGSGLASRTTITNSALATALSAPANHAYVPKSAEVYHGLIVLFCERRVSSSLVGITLMCSQDYGATWAYVPVQGVTPDSSTAAGDVPDWPGTVAITEALKPWSTATFPVDGMSDLTGGWITFSDYINNDGGGGGIIRVTRETSTGTWTIENARIIYSQYLDDAGLHLHCVRMCSVGCLLDWGDGNNRNRITLHSFDLESYATATVTDDLTWHGEFDSGSPVNKVSPQIVSPVPAPDGGTIGAVDLNGQDAFYHFADVTDISDEPVISRIDPMLFNSISGSAYDVMEALHLKWCRSGASPRYVGGGANQAVYHVSRDGVTFARLSLAGLSVSGRICTDGRDCYILGDDNEIKSFAFPRVTVIDPVSVYKGGDNNYDGGTWGNIASPYALGGTNTRKIVYWQSSDSTYRYDDDDTVVPGSPSIPPLHPDGVIYEIGFVDNINGGGYKLRNSLNSTYPTGDYVACWAFFGCNPDRGIALDLQAFHRGNTIQNGSLRQWQAIDNQEWTKVVHVNEINSPSTGNVQPCCWFRSRKDIYDVHPNRILIQPLQHGAGDCVKYQADYETTDTPDESLSVSLGIDDQTWTVATLAYAVEDVVTPSGAVCTIYADADNYVELTYDKDAPAYSAEIVVGGVAADTLTVDVGEMRRGDPILIALTSDGSDITLDVTTPTGRASDSGTATLSTVPATWRTGNADGSSLLSMDHGGVAWSDQAADSDDRDEIAGLLTSSFTLEPSSTPGLKRTALKPRVNRSLALPLRRRD